MNSMTTPEWPDFDPELAAWMVEAPRAPAGSSVEVMRENSRRNSALTYARMSPSLLAPSVRDDQVDGPGGPIPVRIFTPDDTAGAPEHRPLIVFFHGSGWVIMDLDTHMSATHRLCVEVGAVVVSVGYRLAPEDRFPAAFDDCVAATEWASAYAEALGADPNLLVVAGDSAGGQLAASVAQARRNAAAPLAAQLLYFPATDLAGGYRDETINARYPSRTTQALGPGLTLEAAVFYADTYTDEADAADWRASPLRGNVDGVAPAVVHTARFDVLRDEGRQYADALRAAGVTVTARDHPTLNHGYLMRASISAAAEAAAAQASADLRDILGLGT